MLFIVNWIVLLFMGQKDNNGSFIAKMILFGLQLILPIISFFLSMFLSRERELLADTEASLVTNKTDMANALIKINNNYREEQYYLDSDKFIKNAFIFGNVKELFSTHPSLEKRLENLGFKRK